MATSFPSVTFFPSISPGLIPPAPTPPPIPPVIPFHILLETGDDILTETGGVIVLE